MTEKLLTNKKHGIPVMILLVALYGAAIFGIIHSVSTGSVTLLALSGIYLALGGIPFAGLKTLKPQEALVLTLFGKYYGTLKGEGFYYVNPFCTAVNPAANTRLGQSGDIKGKASAASASVDTDSVSGKRISLKIMTLNNSVQKINDAIGNPIEIGIAVMWRVTDTTKAVFNVDNYK